MGSGNQVNTVDVTKVVSDFWAEYPSCASGIDGPVLDVFGVGPHQIAEGAFMGNFNFSVNGSDLVDGLDFWTETSVNTESFSVDDGSDWQVVKDFCAVFPWIGVSVLSVDFIIKAINGGDLSKLR